MFGEISKKTYKLIFKQIIWDSWLDNLRLKLDNLRLKLVQIGIPFKVLKFWIILLGYFGGVTVFFFISSY